MFDNFPSSVVSLLGVVRLIHPQHVVLDWYGCLEPPEQQSRYVATAYANIHVLYSQEQWPEYGNALPRKIEFTMAGSTDHASKWQQLLSCSWHGPRRH